MEVFVNALVVVAAAVIAALVPMAIKGIRASRAKDQADRAKDKLIEDLVLGDPSRGVKPMRDLIEARTTQIQPDANGGTSLPDLHAKLAVLTGTVTDLRETTERTEAGTYSNSRDIALLREDFDKHVETTRTDAEAATTQRQDIADAAVDDDNPDTTGH
jgi:hypothetical protein